jgi:hypothetical protein
MRLLLQRHEFFEERFKRKDMRRILTFFTIGLITRESKRNMLGNSRAVLAPVCREERRHFTLNKNVVSIACFL